MAKTKAEKLAAEARGAIRILARAEDIASAPIFGASPVRPRELGQRRVRAAPSCYLPSCMAQPARRPATYEDVLAAPEHMVAQVLDGELHLHPRPARRHTRSASLLGARLASLFDDALQDDGGDWVVRDEPELHLRLDILVPDLAAWRLARFPGDDDEDEAYFTVAPDWACEILSASTARIDRLKKVPIYAREGVGHLWLVDPRDKTIEVLRLRDLTYELVGTWGGDEGPFVLPPFESAALPAAAFWGRTTARSSE